MKYIVRTLGGKQTQEIEADAIYTTIENPVQWIQNNTITVLHEFTNGSSDLEVKL